MNLSPVIIIGMHRSGTSLLGRLLEELGVYFGQVKDENDESLLFRNINEWLLSQAGGRWDLPAPMHYVLGDRALSGITLAYVRQLIASPRAVQFLGWKGYLRGERIFRMDRRWGWKDPRNTFTLPLWLELFPQAKVIHIRRHGVDVAQSLTVRSRKGLERTTRKLARYGCVVAIRPKRGGFVESPRCARLQGGFSLWQEYVSEAERHGLSLPASRFLNVQYEQLLSDPENVLTTCADFLGLEGYVQHLSRLRTRVDSSRALAHTTDEQLVAFASQHRDILEKFGY